MKDRRLPHWIAFILINITVLFLTSCGNPPTEDVISVSPTMQTEDDLDRMPVLSGDEIELLEANLHQDMFDNWLFSGLIQNTADYAVGKLEMELECLDSAGSLIYTGVLYEMNSGLLPKGSMPVQTSLIEAPDGIDHCDINVTQLVQIPMETALVEVVGLNLVRHTSNIFQITGDIYNSTDEPVILNYIRSVVHDDDKLIAVLDCEVCPSYLRAGERGPFRQSFFGSLPASIEVDEVETFVAAQPFTVLEGLEVLVDDDHVAFLDSLNTYHILGAVQNQREESLNITLQGALYDQEGRVLDAATTEVVPRTLGPGGVGFYELRFGGPHSDAIDPTVISSVQIRVEPLQSQILSRSINILPLSLIETEASISGSSGVFKGEVVNETEIAVNSVEVAIVVLDPSSTRFIGVGHHLINVGLLPGETAEFQIQLNLDPLYGDQDLNFLNSVQGIPTNVE